ncbi:alpha/beta fold hydrolase [Bacillus alkalicellulosilyticus]|uniref:alpha/beta fold hydrolase n=1 Tax=Alkalihalobacterium alkalicellulosilyticum TaxID=1912214 RepID=UPI0009980E85|nr:alpha/beta hydrolase [Bacillus alkalicellulosilyticus]
MSLHYQEYGDKEAPLIVFLHGGGVSSWMWDKQIQYFKNYHCIAVDLPEQGKSNQSINFSIEHSAISVIELIENLGKGKKVIIIGFSLGSQVTIQILSMKPNLIDYAIINSALVRPSPLVKKMIKPAIKLTFPLIKNKSFSRLQAKTLYINNEYFETYYKESTLMKSETLVRILEENMSFVLPKNFNKAKSKILVTVGEKEKTVMIKSAKDIVSNNSNCVGIIVPKIGHGVSLVKPDFFNEMIENWITEESLPQGIRTIL